jgi:antitoxin (DNA-binding transcriptional repressor) of toxin-antitoxin stability system
VERLATTGDPEVGHLVSNGDLTGVTTSSYLAAMKAIGIKRLKAQLSEIVRMVKAGETIMVTERDEVVAELRPARRQLAASSEVEEILDELADAGEVSRAGLPKKGWKPAKLKGLPAGTALRILDELSAERDEPS